MRTALVVVVLAACGGGAQSPPQGAVVANSVPRPPSDAAVDAPLTSTAVVMARMSAFRDQLCACTDKACAERITEEMTRWAKQVASQPREEQAFTEADTRQIAAVSEDFARCMTRLVSGPGSGSPP